MRTRTKSGYVYIVTNPAWPGCLKVGHTVDRVTRLSQYMTYDPYGDYRMEFYCRCEDRAAAEKEFKQKHGLCRVSGEWFRMEVGEAKRSLAEISLHEGTSDLSRSASRAAKGLRS